MVVTVKYFGILTDIAQTSEEQFLLKETISTIYQLKEIIEHKYPSINEINYTIALNQTTLNRDFDLKNDDIIALLPPFSGG